MSDGDESDRRQGIDFDDLDEELEGIDYPVSKEELLEEYGDERLVLGDDTVRLREVLSRTQGEDSYESALEVRQTVKNFVGERAVGVSDYSDRGTGHAGEEEPLSGDRA